MAITPLAPGSTENQPQTTFKGDQKTPYKYAGCGSAQIQQDTKEILNFLSWEKYYQLQVTK